MKQRSTVYDIVTNKVIQLLEKGVTPWRKPWNPTAIGARLRPMNYHSKHQYKGINFFLLACEFENPYFLTFKQVGQLKGKVKKGTKSTPVFYWNWLCLDANGKKVKTEAAAKKKIPFLRFYKVFNATQIEGIDFEYPKPVLLKENEKIEQCEQILGACQHLKLVHHDKSKAYYSPSRDVVNMPSMGQFDNSPEYYSTLFHELGHWTGHHTRLNRFEPDAKVAAFGSEEYSKEELIAEMVSAFLCFDCQIDLPKLIQNQAAYLSGWLSKLKSDSKLIVTAAAKAEKAARFIHSNPETCN